MDETKQCVACRTDIRGDATKCPHCRERQPGAEPMHRGGPGRVVAGVCTALARLLGLEVADITCGFKAFRGDLAREVFAMAEAERWGIDAEVLLLAQQRGARIADVPVVWRDGGRSAVRIGRDVLRSFRELYAARRRHGKGRP